MIPTRIFVAVPVLMAFTASAFADRLLQIPTGRKIPFRSLRSELWFEPHQDGTTEYYAAAGLTNSIDFEIRTQRFRNQDVKQALDFSYQFVGPIPDLSPGISVGIQDALNQTSDGRRPYLAFTLRQTMSVLDGDAYGDLTLGTFFGVKSGALIGFSLPVTQKFRLVVDHNGYRAAGGLEIAPFAGASVKLIARGDQTFLTLGYTRRF